ncbi:Uncharacterised protein [Serratia grimesii]|jgi:hypothetical protein|nr:Uncharacterised protein [Serratia grimesii]CAI1168878.1 Uncharacterised protein [Serratia grimesii]CAI1179927.1 Uncharacterised protein [Serratia grimesii]CAI1935781.1 Uncharacterised protein [Serratia grimesii]CAI2520689.1 Uncharacterised protein [Serratia grimesii]
MRGLCGAKGIGAVGSRSNECIEVGQLDPAERRG